MTDNKNMLLAIILSVVVLGAWQYFVGIPQVQRERQAQQTIQAQQQAASPAPGTVQTATAPSASPAAKAVLASRAEVVAASPRVAVETPRLKGSINLKGGRIDDLALVTYRETVDPKSPNIVLLSPSGTPFVPANHHDILENQGPYYADFGWVAGSGVTARLPDAETQWSQVGTGSLTPATPVTLQWDNGAGLVFRRTVAVDPSQMFTVTDAVENHGTGPVALSPYALVSRHGTPVVAGYYVLFEGLIGYLGGDGLQEYSYKNIDKDVSKTWTATGGWLGITDKYWATTLIPDQNAPFTARFSTGISGDTKTYQTDYLLAQQTVQPGATAQAVNHLFSGAKEVGIVDGYEKQLNVQHFDVLIDWGWFYFITKPLFKLIDFLYHLIGNFGLAILATTVILKACFFPLANRSYASMSKMKKVQPEMAAIKERFPDDRVKQQQAMMQLYKEQKINPVSGCLPMLIQIPVFFALYKVLFVTIEMRHQPFYGWIHDLSAPDPTTVFNLFGLIPFIPPAFLMIGFWPIVMGITMFLQMQLNPAPTDPTQQAVFKFMPFIFIFTMSAFPAGLVIYYCWNNTLSILQQSLIMRRYGVKSELWGNLMSTFGLGRKAPAKTAAKIPATTTRR